MTVDLSTPNEHATGQPPSDPQPDPNDSANDTGTSIESGSSESQEQVETETDEFNPSEYEQTFGLPAGTLKDATDAESALAAVREYADRTLTAGLGFDFQGQQKPAETKAAAKGAEDKSDGEKGSGNAELDALRAELVEVKGMLQQNAQAQQQRMEQELERRISAEIDSWDSPKYGKSQSRNFNQTKADKEIRELMVTHITGLHAHGQPAPEVEKLLRQVRAFHDSDYSPAAPKQKQAPLGTPNAAAKQAQAGNAPRNIHEALMGNRS